MEEEKKKKIKNKSKTVKNNERSMKSKDSADSHMMGSKRLRADIPSPLKLTTHPVCYRAVPWSCRVLWGRAVNVIL